MRSMPFTHASRIRGPDSPAHPTNRPSFQDQGPMQEKPGFIIWSSAIVSVALSVAAVSNMLAQSSGAARNKSLGILLICVLAAAAAVWRLIRLYRTATEVDDMARIPVGVPIRPSRGKALAVAIAMLAIGALPLAVTSDLGPILHWGSCLMIAGGAAMLAAVLAGIVPAGGIALREEGLALAGRGLPIVLPWERISAVEGGEFGGNPAGIRRFFCISSHPRRLPCRRQSSAHSCARSPFAAS